MLTGNGTVGVKVDGETQNPGKDVQDGKIAVNGDRVYHLVRNSAFSIGNILELDFSPEVQAFAFTFGS